ncbi:MAG: cation-translocating P-type ATPase, partial [Clostridia bacterium]|nr:cation-translocating P-type ATPase [Clostridia bacterium]
MTQYTVTGMTCAACQARVEKAVTAVPGVESCAVSLLTNSMGVEGTASPSAIVEAVQKAGYGASPKETGTPHTPTAAADPLADRETPALLRRLIPSAVLSLLLMYVSMGHTMWGWPLPAYFADNPLAIGLAQLLLAAAVMVINQKFFVSGVKGVLHLSPNMDTLVAMGAGAAFVYSTWALFAMCLAAEVSMEAAR